MSGVGVGRRQAKNTRRVRVRVRVGVSPTCRDMKEAGEEMAWLKMCSRKPDRGARNGCVTSNGQINGLVQVSGGLREVNFNVIATLSPCP